MEADVVAQFDQKKARAIEELGDAKSFIVITSDNYTLGQGADGLPEDYEVNFRVVLGCDDHFMTNAMDIMMRNIAARALFPEMFDEYGRPGGGQ